VIQVNSPGIDQPIGSRIDTMIPFAGVDLMTMEILQVMWHDAKVSHLEGGSPGITMGFYYPSLYAN
jgi:hypothetical protein